MKNSNPKFKSDPQNRFQVILDKLVLTRYSVIETDASPDEVLESLHHIQEPEPTGLMKVGSFLWTILPFEQLLELNENSFSIKVNANKQTLIESKRFITLINVDGGIVYSDGYEKTLVHLKSSFSLFITLLYPFFLIFIIFNFVFFHFLSGWRLYPAFFLSICWILFFYSLFFYAISAKRKRIVNSIHDAIRNIPENSTNINHDSYDEIEVYEDETMDNLYMDNA